jgi:hypothetical protein
MKILNKIKTSRWNKPIFGDAKLERFLNLSFWIIFYMGLFGILIGLLALILKLF